VDSGPEKKLTKLISEVLKRAPVLHLFGNIHLLPVDFLGTQLPSSALASTFIKEAQKEASTVKTAYLASLDEDLTRSAPILQNGLVNWLVSFDSTVSPMVQQLAIHAMLGLRLKQLAQGVFLGNRLCHIVRTTIQWHLSLEEPLSKEQVRRLQHAAEFLKAVRTAYYRRSKETTQGMPHMIQWGQAQIRKQLLPLKAQLEADLVANSKASGLQLLARSLTRGKDLDTKIRDALSAVSLALETLQGQPSLQHRIVLRLCLEALFGLQKRLPEEAVGGILEMCMLVDTAAEIQELVETATDCSFLYWCRGMMPTCFSLLYSQTNEAHSLQYLVMAFQDGIKLLELGHAENDVIDSYEEEMENAISNEVVTPLCRDIETDLRLHVHSAHLKGTVNINPTKTGVRDLSWFLQVQPLRLASKYIHIKSHVENYLNAAFYNHAAVSLHNWKTYGEMRQLAEQKYGLELDNLHLPCQTLEQGVDVLEIMRNIHIFVASYTYNLNTQVFIERMTNASYRKHINTISVNHVANSIRTHGTGIISTTVNFTYQYLSHKFIAFSQFLFDDHIKSRLVKERRFFKETKGNERQEYPVARAQKLNLEIRKLGFTESGQSYLDQFRQLIAEMGNALGFVRMVRLGGLSYCSATSGFVQEGKNISFELASKDLGMSPETIQAGKLLDTALETQNMSLDGTNYFNILVNVFSQELQSDGNVHLKDFFLVVPALMISAIEAMLQAKDKLFKRSRTSADSLFTDDGFVLGIAYLLKVLGQDKQFDSLHWFESARKHYRAEKARLEEGLDTDSNTSGLPGLQIWSQKLASISEADVQNMQLAVKRVASYLMELELTDYNLTGARIFFL